ncbi:hypothetical protein F4561_001240 [Lipingzhangella halophila]|uniref:DUF1468 domain-containing protein n=1 Tax=Lipingzhangella halophila TaxID=1783352 RepID=A0A7W7W291_9ACTN|nr:tripartite tricarboxylate transporter TctB family protein [Lipingzhangella halophila]MBB4930420.1 hypothetical protein [Lipingzhangella halophila]
MSETQSTTPATQQVADSPPQVPNPTDSPEAIPERRSYGPVAFYAVIGIIMGIYTILAFDMEWTTQAGRIGPGFFPRIIGFCGIALSLTGVLMSLRPAAAAAEGDAQPGAKKHPALLALIGLALAGFVTVFIPVGAPVTAIAFLLVMYFLIERNRMAHRAVLSVAFPLFLYALFELWLEAGLPGGITDFL